MLRTRASSRLLILALLWMFACPAFAGERVVLQLKWLHQFQFAGYYAALEQGYFAEEGLDVELRERDPKRDVVQLVLDGDAHYGVSDSVLFLKHSRGAPVVVVAAIMQHSANAVMTLGDSGLSSPRELVGRRLSFYDNLDDGIDVMAMLTEHGVPRDRLVRRGMLERLSALRMGDVDAVSIYVTNEPFLFRESGLPVNLISPRHYGFDFYGDMLFTSRTEAEANPQRVAALRRAVLRGWQYALDHKPEMVELILERYNTQGKSRAALMNEALGLESLISRHTTELGRLDEGRINHINTQLLRLGLLTPADLPASRIGFPRGEQAGLTLTAEERAFLTGLGPIRVGLQRNGWPPFEETERSNTQLDGIALDYLRELQQLLDVEFEFIRGRPWNTLLNDMKGRGIDLLPAATSTPNRREYMQFTAPYVRSPMIIVTRDDVDFIPDLDRLIGKSVGVVDNFTSDELLSRYFPKLSLIRFDTTQDGLKALSGGQIDAFIDNLSASNRLIRSLGLSNLKISGQTPYSFDLSLGIRDDWPLLASAFDKALAAIPQNQRDEIYARWVHLAHDEPLPWRRLLPIMLAAAAAFALLTLYVVRLRTLNRRIRRTNRQLALTERELQDKNRELRELSITDKLTGTFNRHHLDAVLVSNFDRARRYARPLSLILFDLDRFKLINDQHGHQAGDAVLKRFSALMRGNVRSSDVFGRWGGEEFLLLCPETGLADAMTLAEKLRALCASTEFEHGEACTVSAGVASAENAATLDDFIRSADHALYAAKQAGRNRIMVAAQDGPNRD